jgi:hypothetical protein
MILFNSPVSVEEQSLTPDITFTEKAVRINIIPNNNYQDWYRTIFVSTLVLIDTEWVQLGDSEILTLDTIYIAKAQAYRLRFKPVRYLTGYQLSISSLTSSETMNVAYPNAQVSTSSRITNAATTTTAAVLIPAATDRVAGGYVRNFSATRDLYLSFATTAATVSNQSILVPKGGGNASIPDGYQGQISGIWNGADTAGSVQIVEFI